MVSTIGRFLRGAASRIPSRMIRSFNRPVALFFHGVEQRVDDSRVQSNHHDVAAFEEIANFLCVNFDVLPFDRIADVLRRPDANRHAVFLMCDDGYANNLRAADILERFGLPWTLFVSTRYIDTAERSPVFIARLFTLFAPEGRYEIPNLAPIRLDSHGREAIADSLALRLKSLDAARANEAVAAMQSALTGLPALLERFRSDAFLTWEQVRDLKRRGVEIGAHAHLHWAMHRDQTRDYLRGQAEMSKARIEAEVGPCRAFAYPFGNTADVCREAWLAVRDAGYEYAFTTLSGSLDASANPFLMPRYGLAPRESRLGSVIPALRLGNGRLAAWQRLMGR